MATTKKKIQRENLVALHLAYDALTKAGDDSLRAAYNFGQIIDALTNLYTFDTMAAEIGRSAATVALYARLYRRYARVGHLVEEAKRIGTYDISKLAGLHSLARYHVVLHCEKCGSTDFRRQREKVEAGR